MSLMTSNTLNCTHLKRQTWLFSHTFQTEMLASFSRRWLPVVGRRQRDRVQDVLQRRGRLPAIWAGATAGRMPKGDARAAAAVSDGAPTRHHHAHRQTLPNAGFILHSVKVWKVRGWGSNSVNSSLETKCNVGLPIGRSSSIKWCPNKTPPHPSTNCI